MMAVGKQNLSKRADLAILPGLNSSSAASTAAQTNHPAMV
jgi:hypothetical protein